MPLPKDDATAQEPVEAMERNEMQMIEVLMARLNNLSSKVGERRRACTEDRNADSDLCSSLVTNLRTDMGDDDTGEGGDGSNGKPSVFKPKPPRASNVSRGGGVGGTGAKTPELAKGELYVTFRNEPATDFGRKLEHKVEVEIAAAQAEAYAAARNASATANGGGGGGGGGSAHAGFAEGGGGGASGQANKGLSVAIDDGASGGGGGGGGGGSVRASRQGSRVASARRKADEAAALRAKYEKKLLDNLEQFVTRGALSLHYAMPPSARHSAAQTGPAAATPPFRPPSGRGIPRSALAGESEIDGGGGAGGSGGAGAGDDASTMDAPSIGSPKAKKERAAARAAARAAEAAADAEALEEEQWPIPVSATEFNPKLLVGLSCSRMVLPAGMAIFKRLASAQRSCWLLIYMYWYCHCKYFQRDSLAEQEHLLRHVSSIYVQMMSMEALGRQKDFFFTHYPYLVANCVAAGFYFLCPGSRHLYTFTFKRILYLQCVQVLGGMLDMSPGSVLVHRDKLFPEEPAEEKAAQDKAVARAAHVAAATGQPPPPQDYGLPSDALSPLPAGTNAKGPPPPGPGPGAPGPGPLAAGDAIQEEEPDSAHAAAAAAAGLGSGERAGARRESTGTKGSSATHGSEDEGGGSFERALGGGWRRRMASKGLAEEEEDVDGGGGGVGLRAGRMRGSGGEGGEGGKRVGPERLERRARLAAAAEKAAAAAAEAQVKAKEDQAYWLQRRAASLAPLRSLVGDRHSLRFRPPLPNGAGSAPMKAAAEPGSPGSYQAALRAEAEAAAAAKQLPRQQRVVFDQAQVSPLVQQYLEHPEPFIKAGRRPERMGRTAPVRWCGTGGVETFKRSASRRPLHDALRSEHAALLAEYRRGESAAQRALVAELSGLEAERKAVYRGGAVTVGRRALELVAEIAGRANEGARKRAERAKAADAAREAEERARQRTAIDAQKRQQAGAAAAARG